MDVHQLVFIQSTTAYIFRQRLPYNDVMTLFFITSNFLSLLCILEYVYFSLWLTK